MVLNLSEKLHYHRAGNRKWQTDRFLAGRASQNNIQNMVETGGLGERGFLCHSIQPIPKQKRLMLRLRGIQQKMNHVGVSSSDNLMQALKGRISTGGIMNWLIFTAI